MQYDNIEEYVKYQEEWIKRTNLKDGDHLLVTITISEAIAPKAGDIVIADSSKNPHDETGLSVRFANLDEEDTWEDEIWGVPFYAVTKL